MKRFVIQLSIEDIGLEGEVEGYTDCCTYYVSESFYNKFELDFKNLLDEQK